MSRFRSRYDAKGRSSAKDDHHVRVYRWLSTSQAWLHASGNEIKGLLFIASFDFGDNNGRIHMSERRLSEGIGIDRKTARKVLRGLQDKGFIECTARGSFKAKQSPAAQWRLTWKSWPDRSQGPTHEYRRWQPPSEKSRGEKLAAQGGNLPHGRMNLAAMGGNIPPGEPDNPRKTARMNSGSIPPLTVASGEGRLNDSSQDLAA